jgi:hypothetical protein
MKQITKAYAKKENLKLIKSISGEDMSKMILLIERLKEERSIKYYSMDLILFDQINHYGEIIVSFWGDIK